MSQQVKVNRLVQIIFTQHLYKREKWIIPISGFGDNFQTGQKLTHAKMIGKDSLSPEELEKYPFVINPQGLYKVPDRKWFDLDLPEDKAMYDLIILSGQIANSKAAYDQHPAKYKGYFYDKEIEAKVINNLDDAKFEAEKRIREASLDERKRISLLLNYKITKKDFFINIGTSSDEVLKRELIIACREYPNNVLTCFADNNPGIEKEAFVIEAIHFHLLDQKPNGDVYYATEFLGGNIEEVVKSLYKEDNAHIVNRLGVSLEEVKGSKPISERAYVRPATSSPENYEDQYRNLEIKVKAAIYDENTTEVEDQFAKLRSVFKKLDNSRNRLEEFGILSKKVEAFRDKMNKPDPMNSFKQELMELPLDVIQNKILHNKTPYDPNECKDFWGNKELLVDYMADIKFKVNV